MHNYKPIEYTQYVEIETRSDATCYATLSIEWVI